MTTKTISLINTATITEYRSRIMKCMLVGLAGFFVVSPIPLLVFMALFGVSDGAGGITVDVEALSEYPQMLNVFCTGISFAVLIVSGALVLRGLLLNNIIHNLRFYNRLITLEKLSNINALSEHLDMNSEKVLDKIRPLIKKRLFRKLSIDRETYDIILDTGNDDDLLARINLNNPPVKLNYIHYLKSSDGITANQLKNKPDDFVCPCCKMQFKANKGDRGYCELCGSAWIYPITDSAK